MHVIQAYCKIWGGLSCICLTVWSHRGSQCVCFTSLQVHWQSEQDDNGDPWTLCSTGQGCSGLHLTHILILIHIKAIQLVQSHRTHTHKHTKIVYRLTASNAHLHASRDTHIYTKASKRPIMDKTAEHLWLDRFPRSVWNICQPETYTECRLFTPFGENTHYVNDSSFGMKHRQLEAVC